MYLEPFEKVVRNRFTLSDSQIFTFWVACEPALKGGRGGGEGLAAGGKRKVKINCNYVSGILISVSKRRCEMLIGGDDISNDVITLGAC